MTEKQFVYMDLLETEAISVSDDECYYFNEYGTVQKICELLNELNEEKERWKSMALSSSNENSILWNEISILREQGAEPSDAFKKYLESIFNRIY